MGRCPHITSDAEQRAGSDPAYEDTTPGGCLSQPDRQGSGLWCTDTPTVAIFASQLVLFDPNRDRHSDAGHAVQDVAIRFVSLRCHGGQTDRAVSCGLGCSTRQTPWGSLVSLKILVPQYDASHDITFSVT